MIPKQHVGLRLRLITALLVSAPLLGCARSDSWDPIAGRGNSVQSVRGFQKETIAAVDHRAMPDDIDDDALPDGAVCRLGTTRLRQKGSVGGIAFSSDGASIASCGNGPLQISDVTTGRTEFVSDHAAIACGVLRENQSFLAVNRHRVELVGRTGKTLIEFPRLARPSAATIAQDGSIVLTGHRKMEREPPDGWGQRETFDDGCVRLWSAKSGNYPLKVLRADVGSIGNLMLAPDQIRLAVAGDLGVELWNSRTATRRRLASHEKKSETCLAFSPCSQWLATARTSGEEIEVWEVSSGTKRYSIPTAKFGTRALLFLSDGSLAFAGNSGIIRFWRPSETRPSPRNIDANGVVHALGISPDGSTLAACVSVESHRHTRLWDFVTGRELHRFPNHQGQIESLEFTPDGTRIISASRDQTIRVWNADTGRQLLQIGEEAAQGINACYGSPPYALSPNGKNMLVGHQDQILLIDTATGIETRRLPSLGARVHSLTYCPDGATFVELSRDRAPEQHSCMSFFDHSLYVRDITSGDKLMATGGLAGAHDVAVTCDGSLLVTHRARGARRAATIDFWRSTDGIKIQSIHGYNCAMSPDGKQVAVRDPGTNSLCLLNAKTWPESIVLHHDGGDSLAFSPNSRFLAAGVLGSQVQVFDVLTGDVVWKREVRSGPHAIAFSPCGTRLVATADETTALVWQLPSDFGQSD